MRSRSPQRIGRGGFTLAELVTAASLMTVLMLGVVEVFGIVVETAGEAEGIHFAQQQARAFFNRLHTDIRGMTREGYLAIQKGKVADPDPHDDDDDYDYDGGAAWESEYGADTLAFVTVGPCRSQMNDDPQDAASTEVVYTNHVETPNQMLQVDGEAVAPPRGILGRGLWLLGGTAGGGPWGGQSWHGYLSNLFVDENEDYVTAPQPPAEPPLPRILTSDADGLRVNPWLREQGAMAGGNADSLSRVMACCVSEFFVETFDPTASGQNPEYWKGGTAAGWTYRWSWSGRDTDAEPIETWPPAIRVTVAIHDPGTADKLPDGQDRFRGYVLQETFWLGDP